MKLTDDKRAELVEWTKICGGYRMPDMVVELLESEQAAWQEVDRLSDRLDAEIKFHENTCIKYYAERSDLREEKERLRTALTTIMQLSAQDGIAHELDRCYVIAKEALQVEANG